MLQIQAREVHEMLELAARDTKIKQFKTSAKYRSAFECKLGPPQGFYFDKMQKYAEQLPTVGLTPVIYLKQFSSKQIGS